MIPYLATNLLCDLQQTPELCAAAPTGSGVSALVELDAIEAIHGYDVCEADPAVLPCQQCSAS